MIFAIKFIIFIEHLESLHSWSLKYSVIDHKKLDFNELNKTEVREEYNIKIRNRFDQLAEEGNAIE